MSRILPSASPPKPSTVSTPSFALTVSRTEGVPLSLQLEVGETLFVVGANGTGKSSLMHAFFRAHQVRTLWISAQRQNWLDSGAISISGKEGAAYARNFNSWDTSPNARWKDEQAVARTRLTLFQLVDAENVRARHIAAAVDSDDVKRIERACENVGPLRRINRILAASNLPLDLAIRESDEVVASKAGGPPYSIAELSDGERNAVLIATQVLTAKPGTLLIIDEPERHLHRSISAPLLTALFAERGDCTFIVSTHELSLPLANPEARTLILRGCTYAGTPVTGWDCDVLEPGAEIDEATKLAVLGARRKIVFVEGTGGSLDAKFYGLVFPDATIIPKGSCREVENAVSGIRGASDLTYVQAFGIVDNDHRSEEDVARLRTAGVFPLRHYAIESIYYHPKIQTWATEALSARTEDDPAEQLAKAQTSALEAIRQQAVHLARRIAERRIRNDILAKLPNKKTMSAGHPISFAIDVETVVQDELVQIQSAIAAHDLERLIVRYPIRESQMPKMVASQLGFQNEHQYEGAVRKLLANDPEALRFVRSLFDGLSAELVEGWKGDSSHASATPATAEAAVAS